MGGPNGDAGGGPDDGLLDAPSSSIPLFQIIVLGSKGGPIENQISASLVRRAGPKWEQDTMLGIDGGVGIASLCELMEASQPAGLTQADLPYTLTKGPLAGVALVGIKPKVNALAVWKLTRHYLITHPHLDHTAALILNTAAIEDLDARQWLGLPGTLKALGDHIFNHETWPNLTDRNGGHRLVTLEELDDSGSAAVAEYRKVNEHFEVKAWAISHGTCDKNESGVYDSTAFFIRDRETGREILVFGDVEPDSISRSPRNKLVWQDAAPKIAAGKLSAIMIECSYSDAHPVEKLYGHLIPKYLVQELKTLCSYVVAARKARHGRDSTPVSTEGSPSGSPAGGNKRRRRFSDFTATPSKLSGQSRAMVPLALAPTSDSTPQPPPPCPSATSRHSTPQLTSPTARLGLEDALLPAAVETGQATAPETWKRPLENVTVFINHIKDKITDGEEPEVTIARELAAHEEAEQMGCKFVVCESRTSYYV